MNDKKFTLLLFVAFFILIIILAARFEYSSGGTPSITCSDDGKYVYIVDLANVYKSDNYGENWKKVDPKK